MSLYCRFAVLVNVFKLLSVLYYIILLGNPLNPLEGRLWGTAALKAYSHTPVLGEKVTTENYNMTSRCGDKGLNALGREGNAVDSLFDVSFCLMNVVLRTICEI